MMNLLLNTESACRVCNFGTLVRRLGVVSRIDDVGASGNTHSIQKFILT